MDNSRVIRVAEGKDALTITEFKKELPKHQCNPAQIINISADMSPAFKKGVQKNFPWAAMTFDKFHMNLPVARPGGIKFYRFDLFSCSTRI